MFVISYKLMNFYHGSIDEKKHFGCYFEDRFKFIDYERHPSSANFEGGVSFLSNKLLLSHS